MAGVLLNGASRIIGGIQKVKPVQSLARAFQKDPATALAGTTVASIIIKDGVGCYKYVTQSLHNDKIPDEKRKFVASLDLTNGILMILAQLGMFFAVRKYSGKMFDKMFKNVFNDKNKSEFISRMRMIAKKSGQEIPKKLRLEDEYNAIKGKASDAFKFIVDIAAATIVGKRMIVPLIATPLANKVKKKMDEHDGTTPKTDDKNIDNNSQEEHKLDITNTEEDTNLLSRYKKYYGLTHNMDK